MLVFVDEASCQVLANLHRTWSRVGQTPVVRGYTSPGKIKLIGALTSRGDLDVYRAASTVNQKEIARYLKHLCDRFEDQKLLVVWDNASWHTNSNAVRDFVESEAGSQIVDIEYLPAYAPELNPQEMIWKTLKRDYLGNHQCGVLEHLSDAIEEAFDYLKARIDPLKYIQHVKDLYPVPQS